MLHFPRLVLAILSLTLTVGKLPALQQGVSGVALVVVPVPDMKGGARPSMQFTLEQGPPAHMPDQTPAESQISIRDVPEDGKLHEVFAYSVVGGVVHIRIKSTGGGGYWVTVDGPIPYAFPARIGSSWTLDARGTLGDTLHAGLPSGPVSPGIDAPLAGRQHRKFTLWAPMPSSGSTYLGMLLIGAFSCLGASYVGIRRQHSRAALDAYLTTMGMYLPRGQWRSKWRKSTASLLNDYDDFCAKRRLHRQPRNLALAWRVLYEFSSCGVRFAFGPALDLVLWIRSRTLQLTGS